MLYDISIIMPTYNSESTIEKALLSIRKQKFDQTRIEVIVIDGGSNDKTLEIARKYGAVILENSKRLPEFAKLKGLLNAKGEWGIFIDSDEMFVNEYSFINRLNFLKRNKNIKNLVSTGMQCSENETGINRYANYIGDPFSHFIYRYNGYNRMIDMKHFYRHENVEAGVVFDFKDAKYIPLYDALGNMFNIKYALHCYANMNNDPNFAANIFSNMVNQTKVAAMLENDFIIHTPELTNRVYMTKMVWRIKNNIFQKEGVGFAARTYKNPYINSKKVIFIMYSITFVPVAIDALYMTIKNKDTCFLSHIIWNEFVFCCIGIYYIAKIFRIPVKTAKSYGK